MEVEESEIMFFNVCLFLGFMELSLQIFNDTAPISSNLLFVLLLDDLKHFDFQLDPNIRRKIALIVVPPAYRLNFSFNLRIAFSSLALKTRL